MANSEASIRLYLDADVNAKLAVFLRSAGYDCISAREIGHDTLDDEFSLTYAANDQRTLLTHNTQDFIPIFERWWHADRHHCGIIVSQQIPLGDLQRRILRLLESLLPEAMQDNIRNLAEFALRDQ